MSDAIPDAVRREILRLDMHDVPVAEIVERTGVKRSTASAIIIRARGPRESAHRGDIVLFCNPAKETLRPGARFNWPDLNSMIALSGLEDGTVFEVTRRDGSTYKVEVREGHLMEMRELAKERSESSPPLY